MTDLNQADAEMCKKSSSNMARIVVVGCKHVAGDVACLRCIQESFEVWIRRMTANFRREGVGPCTEEHT